AYTRCVGNFADNAVSVMRLTNNMIFSNLDSWKTGLQQAKDNSKHISNLNVNAAKTFEHNSKEVAAAVSDANSKDNTTASNNEISLPQALFHNKTTKKSNHSFFPIEK
ncbi:MAG: hypothetical protein M3Z01_09310, partial [Thermoproteota archaeon]|nr:hypothetical protein [Thermoproteota archaeon]